MKVELLNGIHHTVGNMRVFKYEYVYKTSKQK